MEEEPGKQLPIRESKGSRKVTLTEKGMILRKHTEEIIDLVRKTEKDKKAPSTLLTIKMIRNY